VRDSEKSLRKTADRLGVPLSTYSPGDGVTRYRFGTADYFAGHALATVLGAHDAGVWLDGYGSGVWDAIKDPS
jgi:hypothetical protein